MKRYKLIGKILSPLYIGTGSEIEPFNYVIRGNKFYKISLEDFVFNLSEVDKNIFTELIDRNNINDIRQFIIEKWDPQEYSYEYSCDVSEETNKIYKENISNIENQLLINPFIRTTVEKIPYLPGSSLKGAIRTAIVSELAKKERNIKYVKCIEAKVLKCQNKKGRLDAKRDPFRAIKIKDSYLPSNSTILSKVINISGQLRPLKIQMLNEVTYSYLSGKTVEFESELVIDNKLQDTKFLNLKIDIDLIKTSCNSFYKDKLFYEIKKFYRNTPIEQYYSKLSKQNFEDNSLLIRVGRFSGVESVTLDNYRKPIISKGKTSGKTRNICEMKYPFGWIKLNFQEV